MRNGSVEPPFPADEGPRCGKPESGVRGVLKSRNQELREKAESERKRRQLWLLAFKRDRQPKLATLARLRQAAIGDLNISKSSFDAAWIGAIEDSGCHDWYEPLHRQRRTRS
jgi:hypothetical protein